MITGLYALGRVVGADWLIMGFLVCALIYLSLCCMFEQNRKKAGLNRVLIFLFATASFCDLIWYFLYFPGGEYVNRGIGSVVGALIWPGLLFLSGIVVTLINEEA